MDRDEFEQRAYLAVLAGSYDDGRQHRYQIADEAAKIATAWYDQREAEKAAAEHERCRAYVASLPKMPGPGRPSKPTSTKEVP